MKRQNVTKYFHFFEIYLNRTPIFLLPKHLLGLATEAIEIIIIKRKFSYAIKIN